MTAIPQTVRAAKQGIPYNVLSNFGDLFKRENLREAWRLLRKNDPFDYQIQVADAILYSCLNGLGWYFVVQITRQAGKNEISAFLQHYLLLYGWYFGIPVSGVKFAPVYKPQIQASSTSFVHNGAQYRMRCLISEKEDLMAAEFFTDREEGLTMSVLITRGRFYNCAGKASSSVQLLHPDALL